MAGLDRDIKLVSVIEKNKIASKVAFLVTLEIKPKSALDGTVLNDEVLYLVNNTEDIFINGRKYQAFPFSIDQEEVSGAISEIHISVQDITRAVQAKMQAFGGGVGSSVVVSVYNSQYLDGGPELSEEFDITTATADDYNVSFTLGVQNPLSMKFPKRLYLREDFPMLGVGNLGY